MPRYDGKVTVWIQKDDRKKWDALTDIPSFIHNALNPELDFSEVDTSTAAVEYGSLKPDPSDSKPIKNPKTIGVPDMFSRVKLVEPMEEKIVDGVKMRGADTTKGYYLETEVIKTPTQAKKALKPLTEGHITYFKKGKK